MNKNHLFSIIIFGAIGLAGCSDSNSHQNEVDKKNSSMSEKIQTVMSKESQNNMTPDEALNDLMKGNERYLSNSMTVRDLPAQISASTDGQFPKAVVLACIDSRVPVEYIFDQGIGDIFVARVAGNVDDPALLGSMEYGLGVAGSKLLMVLGHENCGAVKSAIEKVDVGSANVTSLLTEIEPSIHGVEGDRDSKNKAYFDSVVKNNVLQTVKDIRNNSAIISSLETEGKVKVVGAYYSLTDGKVTLLEDDHSGHTHSN